MALLDDLRSWLKFADDETDADALLTQCLDATVAHVESVCALPSTYTADVTTAIVMQAAALFKRRETPEGIAAFSDFGASRVTKLDPDVERLLAPYRKFSFS